MWREIERLRARINFCEDRCSVFMWTERYRERVLMSTKMNVVCVCEERERER